MTHLNIQPIRVTRMIARLAKLIQHPHVSTVDYWRMLRIIRTLRTAPRYQYSALARRQAS